MDVNESKMLSPQQFMVVTQNVVTQNVVKGVTQNVVTQNVVKGVKSDKACLSDSFDHQVRFWLSELTILTTVW